MLWLTCTQVSSLLLYVESCSQTPPDRPPKCLLPDIEHDINMKLTRTWQGCTPASTLPRPLLSMACRWTKHKGFVLKKQCVYHISLEWSPAAFSLQLFSLPSCFPLLSVHLSVLSLWGCFSSTCSCQFCVSFHLPVENRQLRRGRPWARVWGSSGGVTEYEGLTGEYRCL